MYHKYKISDIEIVIMAKSITKQAVEELISVESNLVIDERFKHFPLLLDSSSSLPEEFLRCLLVNTRYGTKKKIAIDLSIEYFNDTKKERGISFYPQNKISAIRQNAEYIRLIYPLLIGGSKSVFEPRLATPITINLILMLLGSRNRTEETTEKNYFALKSHFMDGEGPSYISKLTEEKFDAPLAPPNVSRLIKTAKERLKTAEMLLETLLEHSK